MQVENGVYGQTSLGMLLKQANTGLNAGPLLSLYIKILILRCWPLGDDNVSREQPLQLGLSPL